MGDRREIKKNPPLDDFKLGSFYPRLSELERRPSSTSTDHSIRHGHSFRHHHDTRNNSLGYDHPPRRHDHYNSLGHDHPRRQDHFNSRRYDHSSRYDYSSRTLTSLDTPTRQYASLDNESYSYSGFYAGGVSLPRFKPSRFSYKSPNHYYPYGDYSLPPDLSNGHRQHRRRREHADRIECVRVKAGEIRKDRARPSSVRSASIRHSKSSDDNNSIQIDLKSLCDTSLSSRLGGSGSGGGTAGLFPPSVTNSSEVISRLPSQSFSEPCTPFYETAERRNGPPPARGKNGTANPPLQTTANSKNLNVAFSKNDSKVWLSVDSPETGPLKSAAAAAKKTAIVTNKTRTCRTKGESVLKSKTKKSDNDSDGEDGSRKEVLTVLVLSLVKLVDVGLHGFMLGILLYCTYLSAVYCQQAQLKGWHDTDICDKNSSLAPRLMNKSHWKMSVRDWSLIFCIFHCAYFLLAFLADLTFYTVIHNMNKYVLTIFPVERGFLAVLLITDSILIIFSKNLEGVMETQALTALVILATLCTITDTYFVLPRLRYLAKLDLGWLAKSGKFFSWWRPVWNLCLVIILVSYNLITSIIHNRMSIEVIPITVFGIIYIITIIALIIFVCNRRTRLKTYLSRISSPDCTQSSQPDTVTWRADRCEIFLGALGLVSLNYLSIAPVAKPVNFILTNLWLS